MRIGILSDTHDNLPAIKRAVDFFNQQKVQFVLHAGDFIAPFAIPYIDKLACDWHGNCLIVNPGEACGWLSGISTVAVADLDTRIHIL